MRKVIIIMGAALALAGCQTVQQDRALTGAAIGGVAGTAIGAATAPSEPCYVRTRSGRLRQVRCY